MVHRSLGQQMDLFHIEEHTPGMIFWHPKGWKLFTTIQNFMRDIHEEHGYHEVRTPMMLNRSLWETSGHWEKFRENMFAVGDDGEGRVYAVKPMSCPAHIELYDHTNRSYRELPLRYFEFGVVHRNETSGSMHGLMRVRQFTQDDAHIFCRESQILEETKNYIEMLNRVYKYFGFDQIVVKLSTRPDNHFGTSELWDKAENALADACKALGIEYEIQPGEGAFYGPKLEFTLFDKHGRPWQCGTIQCDFLLPSKERFALSFTNENGEKEQPVILHHAVLGSLERWIGILLEQTEGHLPAWLAPVQAVIVQVSEKSSEYAKLVLSRLKSQGVRVVLDDSNDTISSKVAIHSAAKVPFILVVGEKEAADETVAVRTLGSRKPEIMNVFDFVYEKIHGIKGPIDNI